ncbi:mitochondrial fission ELM1 family protein [Magnetospirillum molischianum]|uniref:Predicted nucleoside-diphosphate-sugar epimerase n=1 Tax=Magnetospirillum molischianum DSM 120 TaxID=1150626 RepID=H8FNA4_MAGML|nr:mitochondrial fission ELM1 family protein [Magnetospirillum molischianum]CCG39842.1 Predicted nucleoside-diphosphate-sugar epimerase [Magnetospirillum molischianum DSM 120]
MRDESVPVWVLADDRAGNVSQALGVAESLGLPFAIKTIRYNRWAKLPNLLRGAGLIGILPDSRSTLMPPWPRLVIAAGRRTAPVARWIKRQSGAILAQIMDPGAPGRDDFDLIAIPAHDRPHPAANVIEIVGAPHRVGPARLAAEAKRWETAFATLPHPRIAVIVGGATRQRPFSVEMATDLGRRVADLAATAHGSVLLTTSRRTGAAQSQALATQLPEPHWLHLYGQPGDNPYFGFLALADAIVVTGDSVSMCCEACASPAPVFIWSPPGWVAPKHERLHRLLYERRLARPLDAITDLSPWDRPRLDAAGDIAAALNRILGLQTPPCA